MPPRLLAMCTRVFWNTNSIAKVAVRSCDWAVSDEPRVWFVPRGTRRTGHGDGTSHEWTSKHSSVATSIWDLGTDDGINERGLAAHVLYLNPEPGMYEPADDRPSVMNALWAQYVLDNFASVAEVVEHVGDVRITSPDIRGAQMGTHLAVEDSSGDAAVIEPIGGRLVVHHGPEYNVMANSPVLSEQLENLKRYAPFGGELPPPGDITSLDRFVRSSYFLHYLPEPQSLQEAVAGVLSIGRNTAVPFGAPYNDGGVFPTWWHAVSDVTNLTYYFSATRSPSVFWLDLAALADGTESLALDPHDITLVGDVTSRLEPTALPY